MFATAGQKADCPTYRQERTKEGSERETGAKEVKMRKTYNSELSKTISMLFLKLQVVIAFFKKSCLFKMVSWWHSFNLRWKKKVMDEYGFVTVDLMKSAQTNFGLLDIKDRDFEKNLLDWFYRMDLKRMPGMFLIAIKENQQEGGGGSISVLHHVTVLKESASPDIVGLDSFDAAMIFKGVKSVDLFGNLTPHKGAKKVGAADYFVPSIDELTDGSHPMKGKFVPGAKDVCDTIQSLESKINGVFIPYPLAQLLL